MTGNLVFPLDARIQWVSDQDQIFFGAGGAFQIHQQGEQRFAVTDTDVFLRDPAGLTRLTVDATGAAIGNVTNGGFFPDAPSTTRPTHSFVDQPGWGMLQTASPGIAFHLDNTLFAFEILDDRFRGRGTNAPNMSNDTADNDPTAPSYAFRGDTNTGMYRLGADIIGLAAGDLEVARFETTSVRLQNIFGNTAAGPANIVIAANGVMNEVTSALATKTNFAPLADPLDVIRNLNPFTFESTLEGEGGRRWAGFGNEEVVDVIPEAEAGSHYDQRAVLAYLVAAVQKLIDVEA
jgi:hypothetical protein